MHIEILTEDKSGAVVVKRLVTSILNANGIESSIAVRPHRGCGSIPKDPDTKPARFSSALLDLLPAKCRAYNRVYRNTDLIFIVIMDSDDNDPSELKESINRICNKYAPDITHVIGLCTEEIEAWLLGDKEAIVEAYPDSDIAALAMYVQDSVCGTWEQLCRVVCPDNFEDIIRIGYPAIGNYKAKWADSISKYMNPSLNVSPSFVDFKRKLEEKIGVSSYNVEASSNHIIHKRSF